MADTCKKLQELRVCDLREELEKRRLETSGSKSVLIERLEKVLRDEGIDSAKHMFTINTKLNVAKRSVNNKTVTIHVEHFKEEPKECVNDTEVEEKKDHIEESENNTGMNDESNGGNEIDQVGDVDEEYIYVHDDDDENDQEDNDNENRANIEHKVETINESNLNHDYETNVDNANNENEEGINLLIGEEEQQLLHDEAPDDKEKLPTTKPRGKVSSKDSKSEKLMQVQKLSNMDGKDKKKDDKNHDSDQKLQIKNSRKDDKEKSTTNTSANTTHKENMSSTTATNLLSTKSGSGSKLSSATSASRNLWVSGLSSLTRASDLKTIFSKYGKVIGAKVVTNTRTPGTRCYGYVTMSSCNDASRCIDNLHRTELHGRIISVERTKNEIGSSSSSSNKDAGRKHSESKKKADDKRSSSNQKDNKSRDKGESNKNNNYSSTANKCKDSKERKSAHSKDSKEKKDGSKDDGGSVSARSLSNKGKSHHSSERDRERERREREQIRQREILSFQKIRQERERQRLREKEREFREEERRRREIRERQRQEESRLAEERRKLALERERLEREKAELLRLERERQKLEREKLELERLELKRQQMKIMQVREDPIKRTGKRSTDDRYVDVPERKRTSASDSRYDAPPPPRFDASLAPARGTHGYDKKREDYGSSSSSKRMDDYSTSSKRLDYGSSGSNKRTVIDDFPAVPNKRPSDDYSKRSNSDYISTSSAKRVLDDYGSSGKSSRDDYKRDVEIRHISSTSNTGGGGTSSYHSVGSLHKGGGSGSSSRYENERGSSHNYRRIDDISNTKRYESSSGYGGSSGALWNSSSSHLSHTSGSGGNPTMKSYVTNGVISSSIHSSNSGWPKSGAVEDTNWRPLTSSQDHRYDRTYNERSTGYSSGGGSSLYGSSSRPTQDRYGAGVSSRY